jgi:polygalacturonase
MEYAHGAMVLGSEMSGGVKDLTVSQCYFKHTDRGLRIKTRRGRGKYAVIDGVEFSNIRMDNVMVPLVMNMYYFCDPDGHEEIVWSKELHPVDDGTPYLGAFTFRDMECTDCEWAAGYFYGLPEQPIGQVTIENVNFTFKEDAQIGRPAMMDYVDPVRKLGLYFNQVKKVNLKNVSMSGQDGDRLITIHVDEVNDE